MPIRIIAVATILVLTLAAPGQEVPKPALTGLDPIELASGREVKGNPDLALRQGKFLYTFASAANLNTFKKSPERFAIQFGGACMRMGPLSGGGSADRFHVFDGRIYVFASEACRTAFKNDPKRFIDTDDAVPQGSADAAKKAKALLDKAISAIGGEMALKDLSSLQSSYQITLKQGDKDYKYKRLVATQFPGSHVEVDDYATSKFAWLLLPDSGHLSWEKLPVEPSVRSHMIREFHRQPIHILKAWQSGSAKGFHTGSDKIGETTVERVAIGVGGATTTLSIDPATGRILRASYRARTSSGIRDIDNDYSDFRNENGLVVPHQMRTTHDGKLVTNPAVVLEAIRVNAKIDPELLKKPG